MMEKLKLIISKEEFYLKCLIFLITILLFVWFRDGKLISSGEDGPFLLNPEKALIVFDNLWIENGTGFSTTDFLPRLPFAYFIYSLSSIGLTPVVIQSITFFILMVTGTLSVFKLVKFFNKDNFFSNQLSFFAAFFYLFNPFSLTQVWNRQLYSQYFLFAALPLLLYLFVRGLEEKNFKFIAYFSIASLFLSTTFGLITNVLVIWSVILLYTLYYFFTKKGKIYTINFFISNLILWVVSSLWWVVPFYLNLQGDNLFTNKINTFENLNTLRTISGYSDIYNVSRLLQDNYFFRDASLKDFYSNYYLQILSYLTPVLIILCSLSIFKDKRLRFFTILFLVGLFVSLGSNYPFGFIFEFLFTKISFLQSFRNPYEKFGIVYVLGYSVLFSYSILFLLKNLKSRLVLILFFSFWIYYLSPLLVGDRIEITKIIKPEHPSKISTRFEEVSIREKNYRVTSLPLTGEGISTIWDYSGVEPSLYVYNFPVISYRVNTPIQLDYLNKLNEQIVGGGTFELQLSLLNSKYILLRNDLINEEAFQEKDITQKKVLDLTKVENLNCIKIAYEKNLIENKKVISCTLDKFPLTDSFLIKIESPLNISPIEVNIFDSLGNRNIWREPEQINNPNLTTSYLISSDKTSEKSKVINYNKIVNINIVVNKNIDVENLNLYTFNFYKTPFKLVKNDNNFQKIYSFKNNYLYEVLDFNEPNQFGYINSIKTADSLTEIFSTEKISESLKNTSIVASNQNKNKFYDANYLEYNEQKINGEKIAISKYWIKNNPSKNNLQNLQLLNTYNSQWVVLKDISKSELDGGFLNTYNLIQKSLNNNLNFTHIISNGYANFWQIKNNEDHNGYAVVFLPQIYKDLFIYISGFIYSLIVLFLVISHFKKNLNKN